ncbi:uncharacterized protein LOC143916814 [Arctopsyche grandis]|uniref:uncharacterized protein LOC143916814 n=1 Tax=Arctopsyche grandis TaxID=121162 RepID=UPI00406D9461
MRRQSSHRTPMRNSGNQHSFNRNGSILNSDNTDVDFNTRDPNWYNILEQTRRRSSSIIPDYPNQPEQSLEYNSIRMEQRESLYMASRNETVEGLTIESFESLPNSPSINGGNRFFGRKTNKPQSVTIERMISIKAKSVDASNLNSPSFVSSSSMQDITSMTESHFKRPSIREKSPKRFFKKPRVTQHGMFAIARESASPAYLRSGSNSSDDSFIEEFNKPKTLFRKRKSPVKVLYTDTLETAARAGTPTNLNDSVKRQVIERKLSGNHLEMMSQDDNIENDALEGKKSLFGKRKNDKKNKNMFLDAISYDKSKKFLHTDMSFDEDKEREVEQEEEVDQVLNNLKNREVSNQRLSVSRETITKSIQNNSFEKNFLKRKSNKNTSHADISFDKDVEQDVQQISNNFNSIRNRELSKNQVFHEQEIISKPILNDDVENVTVEVKKSLFGKRKNDKNIKNLFLDAISYDKSKKTSHADLSFDEDVEEDVQQISNNFNSIRNRELSKNQVSHEQEIISKPMQNDDVENATVEVKKSLFGKRKNDKNIKNLFLDAISYDKSKKSLHSDMSLDENQEIDIDQEIEEVERVPTDFKNIINREVSKRRVSFDQEIISKPVERLSDDGGSVRSELANFSPSSFASETFNFEKFKHLPSSTMIGGDLSPRTPIIKKNPRSSLKKLSRIEDDDDDFEILKVQADMEIENEQNNVNYKTNHEIKNASFVTDENETEVKKLILQNIPELPGECKETSRTLISEESPLKLKSGRISKVSSNNSLLSDEIKFGVNNIKQSLNASPESVRRQSSIKLDEHNSFHIKSKRAQTKLPVTTAINMIEMPSTEADNQENSSEIKSTSTEADNQENSLEIKSTSKEADNQENSSEIKSTSTEADNQENSSEIKSTPKEADNQENSPEIKLTSTEADNQENSSEIKSTSTEADNQENSSEIKLTTTEADNQENSSEIKSTSTEADNQENSSEIKSNILNQSAIDRAYIKEMEAKRTNPPVRRSVIPSQFIHENSFEIERDNKSDDSKPKKLPIRYSNIPILSNMNTKTGNIYEEETDSVSNDPVSSNEIVQLMANNSKKSSDIEKLQSNSPNKNTTQENKSHEEINDDSAKSDVNVLLFANNSKKNSDAETLQLNSPKNITQKNKSNEDINDSAKSDVSIQLFANNSKKSLVIETLKSFHNISQKNKSNEAKNNDSVKSDINGQFFSNSSKEILDVETLRSNSPKNITHNDKSTEKMNASAKSDASVRLFANDDKKSIVIETLQLNSSKSVSHNDKSTEKMNASAKSDASVRLFANNDKKSIVIETLQLNSSKSVSHNDKSTEKMNASAKSDASVRLFANNDKKSIVIETLQLNSSKSVSHNDKSTEKMNASAKSDASVRLFANNDKKSIVIETLQLNSSKSVSHNDKSTEKMNASAKSDASVRLFANNDKKSIVIETLQLNSSKSVSHNDKSTEKMNASAKSDASVRLFANNDKKSIVIETLQLNSSKSVSHNDKSTEKMNASAKSDASVRLFANNDKKSIVIETLQLNSSKSVTQENETNDKRGLNNDTDEQNDNSNESNVDMCEIDTNLDETDTDFLEVDTGIEKSRKSIAPSNVDSIVFDITKANKSMGGISDVSANLTRKTAQDMEFTIFGGGEMQKDVSETILQKLANLSDDSSHESIALFLETDELSKNIATDNTDAFSIDSLERTRLQNITRKNDSNTRIDVQSNTPPVLPAKNQENLTFKNLFRKSGRVSSVYGPEGPQRTPFFNRDENIIPAVKESLRNKFKAMNEDVVISSSQPRMVEREDESNDEEIVTATSRSPVPVPIENSQRREELRKIIQENIAKQKQLADENFKKFMDKGIANELVPIYDNPLSMMTSIKKNSRNIQSKTSKRKVQDSTKNKSLITIKKSKLYMKERWITNRLYDFVQKKLANEYGLSTRAKSEDFVKNLADTVKTVLKGKHDHYDRVLALKQQMAKLKLVTTHFEYHQFIRDYLPAHFRLKAIPACGRDVPDLEGNLFDSILVDDS